MPSGKTCKIARVLMGLDVHTLYQQQNLADFAGDFIAKTNGSYITSLSSPGNESVWTPYAFTLGDDAAGQTATLKVQADTNANAEIIVEGGSTCSIKPNVVQCSQFKSGNNDINITTSTGIAGLWLAAPGTGIDASASSTNGWIDGTASYAGAGLPGTDTGAGGNGDTGCALTSTTIVGV